MQIIVNKILRANKKVAILEIIKQYFIILKKFKKAFKKVIIIKQAIFKNNNYFGAK